MVVIILSAAPAGLRGGLTRWLLEVDPGVYVGNLSKRVREQLWELIGANLGSGRALMVYSTRSEQRFAVESLGHEKIPIDVEGCLVMLTRAREETSGPPRLPGSKASPEGWSVAGRRRRFRNSTERALGQQ